jgi:predicted dehydrogenase
MQYRVCFERAVAEWVFGRTPPLRLYVGTGEPISPTLPAGDGYRHEVSYFLDCIERGEQPRVVTLADGAAAVRIVELERQSVMKRAAAKVG